MQTDDGILWNAIIDDNADDITSSFELDDSDYESDLVVVDDDDKSVVVDDDEDDDNDDLVC